MSGRTKYTKSDYIKLLHSEIIENSSDTQKALSQLSLEGVNSQRLIEEGLKRIKRMRLQIAADKTRSEMGIAEKFIGKAKEMAEHVLADASFSISQFMSKEQLLVNFRNFESLSEDDIKEILVKHYTLKLMEEENIDGKDL